jgi:hypothetical protein
LFHKRRAECVVDLGSLQEQANELVSLGAVTPNDFPGKAQTVSLLGEEVKWELDTRPPSSRSSNQALLPAYRWGSVPWNREVYQWKKTIPDCGNELQRWDKMISEADTAYADTGYSLLTLGSLAIACSRALSAIDKLESEFLPAPSGTRGAWSEPAPIRSDFAPRAGADLAHTGAPRAGRAPDAPELLLRSMLAGKETDPPRINLEFADPVIVDLAETPPGAPLAVKNAINVFPQLGVFARDTYLQQQLDEQLALVLNRVLAEMKNPEVGYLLEVNLYENELGVPYIPGGQIVSPIAPGINPVDAVANSIGDFRAARLDDNVKTYRNRSYFVWLRRRSSVLVLRQMLPEHHHSVYQEGVREAKVRRAEAILRSQGIIEHYRIATFWRRVESERLALIQSEQDQQQIRALTEKMAALEAEANRIYTEFQKAREEMSRASAYLGTLDGIATVAELVEKGISAGEIFCRSDGAEKVVRTTDPAGAAFPLKEQMSITQTRIDYHASEIQEYTITLERKRTRIDETDRSIQTLYDRNGVPIPRRD